MTSPDVTASDLLISRAKVRLHCSNGDTLDIDGKFCPWRLLMLHILERFKSKFSGILKYYNNWNNSTGWSRSRRLRLDAIGVLVGSNSLWLQIQVHDTWCLQRTLKRSSNIQWFGFNDTIRSYVRNIGLWISSKSKSMRWSSALLSLFSSRCNIPRPIASSSRASYPR